jgi:hypothetical protein
MCVCVCVCVRACVVSHTDTLHTTHNAGHNCLLALRPHNVAVNVLLAGQTFNQKHKTTYNYYPPLENM